MPRPSLSALSDRELLSRVKSLVEKERATTLEILVHLSEVEKRRLPLSLGYPSLFEYCTRYLGYSSSAAGRRIHAARCVRDIPEVYGLLDNNEVSLSSISLVASILTESNKGDLLSRIRNKSQKEVEAIVADCRPPLSFRDRARPVCVAVPASPRREPVEARASVSNHSRSGSEISPNAAVLAGTLRGPESRETASVDALKAGTQPTPPRTERKLLIQFLASEAFMKKFEEARALLSSKNGGASYEAVLEAALDEFLARHSHEAKKKRRDERERSRKSQKIHRGPSAEPERSRHIPDAVRDEVFARDKGRCTFTGPTGERCGSTHGLEIDHIVPYGRGGINSAANLRLLCAKHNRLEAERLYGDSTIRRFHTSE